MSEGCQGCKNFVDNGGLNFHCNQSKRTIQYFEKFYIKPEWCPKCIDNELLKTIVQQNGTYENSQELLSVASKIEKVNVGQLRELYNLYNKELQNTDKGLIGKITEFFFGLKNNCNAGADFKNINVELKTTPMEVIRGHKLPIERLDLCMINPTKLKEESFEESYLMEKNEKILLIPYCKYGSDNKDEYIYQKPILFKLSKYQELIKPDYCFIQEHFEEILDKYNKNYGEKSTTVLGAHTKGSGNKEEQEKKKKKDENTGRAFCLKNSFMRNTLEERWW